MRILVSYCPLEEAGNCLISLGHFVSVIFKWVELCIKSSIACY